VLDDRGWILLIDNGRVPRFHYACPMRWADLDAQGHVNNAAYLDYLQEARIEFLLSQPPPTADLLASGVLVVGHQVEYLSPSLFDGSPMAIELWVTSVGASRFTLAYELRHGGQSVARARTTAVPYDLAQGRLRRLSESERSQFLAFAGEAEGLRPVVRTHVGERAHRFPLRVRWADLDEYGHVNNVKFFDYIQEARLNLLLALPEFSREVLWLIGRQDVEYLRPVDFRREPYEVATQVSHIGSRSFTLEVALRDPATSTVHATGRTVVVIPAPMGDEQRAALARFHPADIQEPRSSVQQVADAQR
jgi:acyl-CoA thioester hydrolase